MRREQVPPNPGGSRKTAAGDARRIANLRVAANVLGPVVGAASTVLTSYWFMVSWNAANNAAPPASAQDRLYIFVFAPFGAVPGFLVASKCMELAADFARGVAGRAWKMAIVGFVTGVILAAAAGFIVAVLFAGVMAGP